MCIYIYIYMYVCLLVRRAGRRAFPPQGICPYFWLADDLRSDAYVSSNALSSNELTCVLQIFASAEGSKDRELCP